MSISGDKNKGEKSVRGQKYHNCSKSCQVTGTLCSNCSTMPEQLLSLILSGIFLLYNKAKIFLIRSYLWLKTILAMMKKL